MLQYFCVRFGQDCKAKNGTLTFEEQIKEEK